jgi:hypothetical protein
MYRANKVAPTLEHEDFFWWLYEAIEYACKYRGWKDPSKNLNAQQCINKCIDTIKLQKYYDLRLDKRKVVNNCCSMDTPLGDDSGKTIADVLENEEHIDDHSSDDAISLDLPKGAAKVHIDFKLTTRGQSSPAKVWVDAFEFTVK